MEVWVLHGGPRTVEIAVRNGSNSVAFMRAIREIGLTNEEAELIIQKIVQNLSIVGIKASYEILDERVLIHTDSDEFGYMHLSYYIEMWIPNLVKKFGY